MKPVELGNFLSRLVKCGRGGEGLGHALALDFAEQPELWVPGNVGAGTAAGWLTTAARNGGYGARSKITEGEELLKQLGPCELQVGQRS